MEGFLNISLHIFWMCVPVARDQAIKALFIKSDEEIKLYERFEAKPKYTKANRVTKTVKTTVEEFYLNLSSKINE